MCSKHSHCLLGGKVTSSHWFYFFNDLSSFFNRFIYFFLAVRGLCCCMRALSSCREWGLLSSCSEQASHCCGFSCGAQAQLSCGTWGLPKAEVEPVSPALTGRLSTTRPPGKSWTLVWSVCLVPFVYGRLYNMTYRELVFELDFETWEWLDRRGVDTLGWNGGKHRPGRGRAVGNKQTRDWTRVSCVSCIGR